MRDVACRAFLATLLVAFLGMVCGTCEALAARRAFVVGNSAYASAPHLPNPANDARDLARRLEAIGYKVTLGIDLGRAQFLQSFQAFAATLRSDDVALLYFAGHGLQIGGENYLFPVDATVGSEADARTRLVPLNALIADLSRGTRTRLVILDACRNNPFGEKLAETGATRSAGLGQGLARVYAGVGSFIAYSTQPGNVALDGRGRNSPFTEALIRHMADAAADVHAVMRRVRVDVQRATAEQQIPWENSSLIEEMSFAEVATAAPTTASPSVARPPAPRVASAPVPEAPRSPVVQRSYAYVTGLDPSGDNFLALRGRPGPDGPRIATMGPDTLLQILESSGDWRRVQLLDGSTGWAHGNWIRCCRTVGVPVAAGLPKPPPQAAPSVESCDSIWQRRNAIWHRHGYCFTTTKGQQVFGNQGCSRDQAAARAAMSPADRTLVDALAAQEKALGCR
ncbi:MAG: caspase family protein [Hyphomicrobiaceae bacterium]